MLMRFMWVLCIFYYWTWFIWPFAFVFSLAHGIASIIKDKNSSKTLLLIAAVSLLIILAGINGLNFSS